MPSHHPVSGRLADVPDRIRRLWSMLLSGYWVVPSALVVVIGAVGVGLLAIDRHLDGTGRQLGFAGGPESARALLSSIASSTLTLTALVFTITIVVLQQASSQFSPRVLHTFLRDFRNQLTLGIFLGAFVHALLVLHQVRGTNGGEDVYVPGLATATSFLLVIVVVGFFVHHIHHVAHTIRVVEIIRNIFRETCRAIEHCHPTERSADPLTSPTGPPQSLVSATQDGVVTSVALEKLGALADKADLTLVVLPVAGDFVARGMPLVAVYGDGAPDADAVREAVALESERDFTQDPAFGLRQLVEVAERALSPSLNDPSTAIQCLDHIHALLRRLATRPLPGAHQVVKSGILRATALRLQWDDYVRLGLDEIRHWGAGSLQVHSRITRILDDLESVVAPERQAILDEQRWLLRQRRADLPEAERSSVTREPRGPRA